MKPSTQVILDDLISRYPTLNVVQHALYNAIEALINTYNNNGKLLVCGNGGSATDALHIVGELMKSFVLPRKIQGAQKEQLLSHCEHGQYFSTNLQGALPAIALVSEVGLTTAYANDVAADLGFAQQVYGYGQEADVLLAISTSGNSTNILYAIEIAHVRGMKVIGLTGNTGGKMADLCDVVICVPKTETYQIQELHLPIYHTLCLALENEFFRVEKEV